jgi:hypothetical protein
LLGASRSRYGMQVRHARPARSSSAADSTESELRNEPRTPITACSGRAEPVHFKFNRLCAPLMPGVTRLVEFLPQNYYWWCLLI